MDIHNIRITQDDLSTVEAELSPGEFAGAADFTGEACTVYRKARPFLKAIAGVIKWIPMVPSPAAAALQATIAILDQACKTE